MKKKIITAVLLAVACTPLVAFGPQLTGLIKPRNIMFQPPILYELQIGETKYEVKKETAGFITADGKIISTAGRGFFLSVKEPTVTTKR